MKKSYAVYDTMFGYELRVVEDDTNTHSYETKKITESTAKRFVVLAVKSGSFDFYCGEICFTVFK